MAKACVIVSIVIAVALVLMIVLISFSVKKLDSTEIGIQYNRYLKTLKAEPYFEGLHLGSPGYKFIIFPSVFTSLDYSRVKCLNKDGVSIWISASFQYRVQSVNLLQIVEQFTDEDGYNKILTNIGLTAIHDACSVFNTTQFQSDRGDFQTYLQDVLVIRFAELYSDVTDLQVNDIVRPGDYDTAIRAKESAREDIEVALNERPQQLTSARTEKREAETEAIIILNAAKTESNIIMNSAQTEGQAILNDYEKEAETFSNLKMANGLDNEGFLAYMGIRAIASAKNPVQVGMRSPAQTSFLQNTN